MACALAALLVRAYHRAHNDAHHVWLSENTRFIGHVLSQSRRALRDGNA